MDQSRIAAKEDALDTTEKYVECLTRSIAEYERVIAILQTQVREP